MRWIAALAVMVHHARHYSLGEFGGLDLSAPMQAFGLATSYGALAVVIFFVMSGLLVGGKLLVRPVSLGRYAADRFSRIYTVAIPALLFAYALNLALRSYYGAAFGNDGYGCEMNVADLATHVLFLNNGYVPTSCAIGPYWSIHNEVFYYALFPSLLLAWRRKSLVAGAFVALIVGTLLIFDEWGPHSTLPYFPIWIAGALVMLPSAAKLVARIDWRLAGAVMLAALLAAKVAPLGFYVADWMVAVAVIAFLGALARDTQWTAPPAVAKLGKWGADWSFSLYLFHGPVILAVRTVLERGFGMDLGVIGEDGFAAFAVMAVTALLVSWLAYQCFERFTGRVRDAMRSGEHGALQLTKG